MAASDPWEIEKQREEMGKPFVAPLPTGADWLRTLRQKRARLDALRAEVQQLEAELRQARALLSPGPVVPRPARTRYVQQGSTVWWARRILREAGGPMHIRQLVEAIAKASGLPVKQPTLVSNLSRYVTRGDTFTRPAMSVFGLIDGESEQGVAERGAGHVNGD